jgi:hypothetical protein
LILDCRETRLESVVPVRLVVPEVRLAAAVTAVAAITAVAAVAAITAVATVAAVAAVAAVTGPIPGTAGDADHPTRGQRFEELAPVGFDCT